MDQRLAARAFDLAPERVERLAAAGYDGDIHALGCKRQGDGAPDALACAGDERGAPGETEVHLISLN
jgi:hypothetical protein